MIDNIITSMSAPLGNPCTQLNCQHLDILNNIVNSLSFVGIIIFLIFFITYSRRPKPILLKCLGHIQFADFLYCICNSLINLGSPDNQVVCSIDGFIRQFSVPYSVFWAALQSIISYRTVIHKESCDILYNRWKFVCCLLPLLMATIPLWNVFGIEFGQNLNYCWILPKDNADFYEYIVWKLLLMVLPVWLGFLVSVYCYYKVYQYIKNNQLLNGNKGAGKLFVYPAILLLAFLPATIEYVFLSQYITVLAYLHIILNHSMGLFNTLVYSYHRLREHFASQTDKKHYSMKTWKEEEEDSVEQSIRYSNTQLSLSESMMAKT